MSRLGKKPVPKETRKTTSNKFKKQSVTNNPLPWNIDVQKSLLTWPPDKTLAYFENTTIKLFTIGTLNGRKSVDISLIDFDESEEQPRVRKSDETHVNDLQDDFEPGIDYSKKPPTVYPYTNDNGEARYKCYDGHNSISAQKKLGYKFCLVDVIQDPKDASLVETFGTKLALNNHGAAKCSVIEDYVNAVEKIVNSDKQQVTKKILSDTLDSITRLDKKLKNGLLGVRRRNAIIKRLEKIFRGTNPQFAKNGNSAFYNFPHEDDPTLIGTGRVGLGAFKPFPLASFPFSGSAHLSHDRNRILNCGYDPRG